MADYEHVDGVKVASTSPCLCGSKVEFKNNLVNATKCGKCGRVVLNRNYKSNRKVDFHDSKTAKKRGSIP